MPMRRRWSPRSRRRSAITDWATSWSAIRVRRRMLDLTLQDLAGACGVTFQQVHKYESGMCSMSASQLYCVAVALAMGVRCVVAPEGQAVPWRARPDPTPQP